MSFTPSKNSHGSSDARSSRAANGAGMAASMRRKKSLGRGAYASWAISHTELLRFQKEGLLPLRRPAA